MFPVKDMSLGLFLNVKVSGINGCVGSGEKLGCQDSKEEEKEEQRCP